MTFVSPPPEPDASSWWRTRLEPWWRDFDELGHLTAAAYPAAFEEGFARFVIERWDRIDPSYVVARSTIDYMHEVRRTQLPLTLYVAGVEAGESSFIAQLLLHDSLDVTCAVAETRYVAWDNDQRRSRPLTETERAALMAPFAKDSQPSSAHALAKPDTLGKDHDARH